MYETYIHQQMIGFVLLFKRRSVGTMYKRLTENNGAESQFLAWETGLPLMIKLVSNGWWDRLLWAWGCPGLQPGCDVTCGATAPPLPTGDWDIDPPRAKDMEEVREVGDKEEGLTGCWGLWVLNTFWERIKKNWSICKHCLSWNGKVRPKKY